MSSALRLTCQSVYLFKNVFNLNRRQATFLFKSHLPVIHVCHYSTKQDIEDSLKQLKEGTHKTIKNLDTGIPHFKTRLSKPSTTSEETEVIKTKHQADLDSIGTYTLPHPIWSKDELEKVTVTHNPPVGIVDHLAYYYVQSLRLSFDILSGYKFGKLTENKWLHRVIFLETIAGVPGMVAAMIRHLNSLRRMKRDHGWIHTLLEEAENERMHLMVALQIKQPSLLFRAAVLIAQGIFVNLFSIAYILSPRFCHRMVGYLEEEAVRTYTKLLQDLDAGCLPVWSKMDAPEVAIRYWNLPENAKLRDMVLAIRADEAHHRLVNHTLGSMHLDEQNPFKPGQ